MALTRGKDVRPEGANCDKCGLREFPYVPGYGPDTAGLVIVGEAPGDTEVLEGKPFVGRAGQLLNRVLEEVGLDRSTCYISNACLCRPVPHRAPRTAEIKACRERLLREVRERLPRVVVAMGNAAVYALLGRYNMGDVHGTVNWSADVNAYVVPTYHPAAVLRSPAYYIDLVRDMRRVAALLQEKKLVTVGSTGLEYTTVHTYDQVLDLVERLNELPETAMDVETASDGRLLCIGFSWRCNTAVVVTQDALADPRTVPALDRALRGKVLIGHNLKHDIQQLWWAGFANPRVGADTMLMHYVLDERPGIHKLKPLVRRYLNAPEYDAVIKEYYTHMEDCPPPDLWRYNAHDAAYTWALRKVLEQELDADGRWLLHNLLYPAANVLARMEYTGIMVDRQYLQDLAAKLRAEAQALEQEMYQLAGREFNPRSPKQLVQLLYYDLGLPIPERYSTDEDALTLIQDFHPLPAKILEYRGKLKMLRTYVDALLENADDNDRVHTTFNLHGTVCVTGDTIVLTNRGWYRIRDLFPPHPTEGFSAAPPGLLVYDGSVWQPVTHLFYGGRRPTLCVKLALGVTLRCTVEHPLLTERGWVAAGELRPGDYVLTAMGVTPNHRDTIALSPELARLIGYYVADGTLDLPGNNGSYRLRIANRNPAVKADVAYCITRVMGKEPYVGATSVEVSDKEKVLWFARLVDYESPREKGLRAYHKTCPVVIRRGNRRTIVEYLRGLTNDASFSVTAKEPYCVFRTVNRDVAQWAHQLLLALGYCASLEEVPDQVAKCGRVFAVRLRGNEALRFLRDIRPVRLDSQVLERATPPRDWCRKHTKVDAQGRIWLKVLDVQEGSTEDVFDLTVHDTHAFTTNCIISHNTGRLSSSDPINLQNIPKTEEARNAFIATPGYALVEGDLSQAEVRVLAWYCKDPNLIRALAEGGDLHIRTACIMFRKKPEEVTPEMRQAAKRLTFGQIYGQSVEALAKELGVSVTEARELQEQFFEAFPRVREWIRAQQELVLATGVVTTPFKRRRRFEYITRENKAEVMRQSINTPIQSVASDVTLSALIRMGHKLGNSASTRLLLTVHDSILLETIEDPIEVALWVKKEMTRDVLDGTVPFEAEVKVGQRWGSLEKRLP